MNTDKYRFEITRRPRAQGTTPPAVENTESPFGDDAGRDLVDLVDRSHFQLAAHQAEPVFDIDRLLSDDPPTS